MHLDFASAITIICSLVLPFVVDVVTKANAPAEVKRYVALGLTVLAGVLPTVVWSPGMSWTGYLFNVIVALAASQGLHRTGITNVVEKKTADVGISSLPGVAATDSADDTLIPPPDGNPGDVGDDSGVGERVA